MLGFQFETEAMLSRTEQDSCVHLEKILWGNFSSPPPHYPIFLVSELRRSGVIFALQHTYKEKEGKKKKDEVLDWTGQILHCLSFMPAPPPLLHSTAFPTHNCLPSGNSAALTVVETQSVTHHHRKQLVLCCWSLKGTHPQNTVDESHVLC